MISVMLAVQTVAVSKANREWLRAWERERDVYY
jgi:hypothetical protein